MFLSLIYQIYKYTFILEQHGWHGWTFIMQYLTLIFRLCPNRAWQSSVHLLWDACHINCYFSTFSFSLNDVSILLYLVLLCPRHLDYVFESELLSNVLFPLCEHLFLVDMVLNKHTALHWVCITLCKRKETVIQPHRTVHSHRS